MAKAVHYVCDSYVYPSFKDIERKNRGADDMAAPIIISGPAQKLKDFNVNLHSSKFKIALLRFLSIEWGRDVYKDIIKEHNVYIGLDKESYLFEVKDEKVVKKCIRELACELADTRIVWYVSYAIRKSKKILNVSVRTTDTDVMVILIHSQYECQSVDGCRTK